MDRFFKFGSELFWTMFWVFAVLIAGFAILGWLSNQFSGNIIGQAASWVEENAQP